MMDSETLREDYLARLDEAMRPLPHGVASEIRRGIAEELEGLDAEATATRIAQLGDPTAIAREAQDEVPVVPTLVVAAPVAAPAAPKRPVTATRGFSIAAALTLSFGGFVLPFVGWIVGVVLVFLSTAWKLWEKLVAVALPLLLFAVSWLLVSAMSFSGFSSSGSSSGTGTPPEVVNNPLVPFAGLSGWHALILLGFLAVPASGLWLLWRLRGRTDR